MAQVPHEEWTWTNKKELAAQLSADDSLSDVKIAKEVGIATRSLTRWKLDPEFRARVAEHVDAWKLEIRKRGLAIKERRIESYIRDFEATNTILVERGNQQAQAVDVNAEPYAGGASTGFVVKDFKGLAPVYSFDAALMRERLSIRKQLAQELGEWSEKQEVSGPDGGPIETTVTTLVKLPDHVLNQVEQALTDSDSDSDA